MRILDIDLDICRFGGVISDDDGDDNSDDELPFITVASTLPTTSPIESMSLFT